jgi:Holliday junction resolvasome RuvABC endonuclease subunit
MLLALDLATKTGFCAPDMSGTIFLDKAQEPKHIALYSFLLDSYFAYDLEVIAVERAAGQHKNALISMAKLHGVVELFAERFDIKVVQYSAGTIKKSFTGDGRASKEMMMDEFEIRKGIAPQTDDEADAYALFCIASFDEFPNNEFPVIENVGFHEKD